MTSSKAASTRMVNGVVLVVVVLQGWAAAAASNTVEYTGCSEQKCIPGSQYSSNVNSLLTSLLTASSSSVSSNQSVGSAHGIFQCNPDVSDCPSCVSACMTQLSASCPNSVSGAIRMEGCYLRYDNVSFMGVEDKTLVLNKCGAQQLNPDSSPSRDSVLHFLEDGTQMFRKGSQGDITGEAECLLGLTPTQCQDCLEGAIRLLKTACLYTASGNVFLASCYARYALVVPQSPYNPTLPSSNTDAQSSTKGSVLGTQKTLAVIIGIIAIIGVIVIVFVLLRKYAKSDDDCDHACHHK